MFASDDVMLPTQLAKEQPETLVGIIYCSLALIVLLGDTRRQSLSLNLTSNLMLGIIWRVRFELDPSHDWLSADPTPKITKSLIAGFDPPAPTPPP